MKTQAENSLAGAAPRSFRARVLENLALDEVHFLLTFSRPPGSPEPKPGQFYMVGVGSPLEPLLKRPFCFFRLMEGGVQILYRVRGKGTTMLSAVRPGEMMDIIGPLGNSYPLPPRGLVPVVLAGGTALASVFPLIKRLKGKAVVLYGARDKSELLMLPELEKSALEIRLSTDNGSAGSKGTVMDLLKELSPTQDHVLYTCGPRPMTRAVAEYAAREDIRGYASLEEYMACGIGACMGCVCKTRKGYRRVCREGPVFALKELV